MTRAADVRSSMLLEETLGHLRVLVSCDTRNPPRAIRSKELFDYLRVQLHDFDCSLADHGAGAISLLAVRGKSRLLFNVHLDTVPDSSNWHGNPFELRVENDRAIGLGVCDIKGAAAALLAVANGHNGDLALLFTTDEEGRDPRCVGEFLKTSHAFDAVIVAEPTRCEAILAHRGIHTAEVRFTGHAGHASADQRVSDSAVHQAVRWGAAALDYAQSLSYQRFGGLTGLRFNIGRIEGGIKPNVIAPSAELRFAIRPLPSMPPQELLENLRTLIDPPPAHFTQTFSGPPLPAGDIAQAEARRLAARDLADELGLPIGNAVDFWTEASLFSQAGCTAFVYGPGDIAQAHSADEWVTLEQLRNYAENVSRIVQAGLT